MDEHTAFIVIIVGKMVLCIAFILSFSGIFVLSLLSEANIIHSGMGDMSLCPEKGEGEEC